MTKVTAFCPGHVTCVFRPSKSYSVLGTGSLGIGLRLGLGATVTVERIDGPTEIFIDGRSSDARVTAKTAEILAPGINFRISAEHQLPVGQGFGMSAAGALSAALCIADLTAKTRSDAFFAAHRAEVAEGGGLGDVAAIVAGRDVPVRKAPGIPPYGKVCSAPFRMDGLTLVAVGPPTDTGSVLSDPETVASVCAASDSAMERFCASPTPDRLFEVSNGFSSESGLESSEVSAAIGALKSAGLRAGMCMLGNSLFTDASEKEVWAVLGRARAKTFPCATGTREIQIVRRA